MAEKKSIAPVVPRALKICGSTAWIMCYAGALGAQKVYSVVKRGLGPERLPDDDSLETSWLEDIFISVTDSLPVIWRDVLVLKREIEVTVEVDDDKLAYLISNRLIKKSMIKSGVWGGMSAVPAAFPGIGSLIVTVAELGVDFYLLLKTQIELCYGIAIAYQSEMTDEELQAVTMALLGFSNDDEKIDRASSLMIKTSVDRVATKYLRVGLHKAALTLSSRLGLKVGSRAARVIPVLGVPLSASLNIASTRKVGARARKYFSARRI